MTKYAILIYEDEARWASADKQTQESVMQGHGRFASGNAAAILGGDALHATSTATSIRKDPSGGFLVTDGAFVETKEALGGFYLVEAADLDAAIALAKQVPAVFGGVEVRPVMVFD
ncbi:MAG: YciI family protein [Chloroflexota bacterium]